MYVTSVTIFRPLAGIRGLRTLLQQAIALAGKVSFRPLTGIRGLRTQNHFPYPHPQLSVSVPLRGLEVFEPVGSRPHLHPTLLGFRPLTGIRGLRTELGQKGEIIPGVSFRPLAGIRGLRTDSSR